MMIIIIVIESIVMINLVKWMKRVYLISQQGSH